MHKSKYVLIIMSLIVLSAIPLSHKVFGEAPANDESDLTQESLGLKDYQKEGVRYNFKYPSIWKVYEIPKMSYLRVENMDANTLNKVSKEVRNQYFKIEVVTLPNNGLSLKDWVQKQNTISYPLPKVIEQKNIEIVGQPAVYQVEQFGSFVHPVIFISKEENIYVLNISSIDEKFKPQVEEFIKNFKFN